MYILKYVHMRMRFSFHTSKQLCNGLIGELLKNVSPSIIWDQIREEKPLYPFTTDLPFLRRGMLLGGVVTQLRLLQAIIIKLYTSKRTQTFCGRATIFGTQIQFEKLRFYCHSRHGRDGEKCSEMIIIRKNK